VSDVKEIQMLEIWVETFNLRELGIDWVRKARAMLIELDVCPHCIEHADYDPHNERRYCVSCQWNSDWEL
jgi:hypothetical protein